ncbi:MAG: hypothetical protein R3Y45_07420 [Bacillota bacterium]
MINYCHNEHYNIKYVICNMVFEYEFRILNGENSFFADILPKMRRKLQTAQLKSRQAPAKSPPKQQIVYTWFNLV